MKKEIRNTKKGFWGVFLFYFLVAFEFAYMAGPFAVYFYSLYSPVLNFLNKIPILSWTIKFFLPHVVRDTSSPLINGIEIIGIVLSLVGFLIFVIGACQIYYSKLTKKGAVLGGLYKYIRHPQYTSFIVCSFGLLLLWPRYIVIFFYVTLIFGYYLLARAEERECEEKFGDSYIKYEQKTGRFFPQLPFIKHKASMGGKLKVGKLLLSYVLTLSIFLLTAYGLNFLTIQSLHTSYENNGVTVSLCNLDEQTIRKAVEIAKENPEVETALAENGPDALELNYILPTEWFAAEVPMNGLQYKSGHKSTSDYNKNQYKIIFMNTTLSEGNNEIPTDILWKTTKIHPLIEVWVDLEQAEVTDVKALPEDIKYEGIPEAIY